MIGGPRNELELDVTLRRVVLRDFTYRLGPIHPARAEEPILQAGSLEELADALEAAPVDGLELELTAKDTGLTVSLRLERGEFVNIATAGLAMLDAADAATDTAGGGDNG